MNLRPETPPAMGAHRSFRRRPGGRLFTSVLVLLWLGFASRAAVAAEQRWTLIGSTLLSRAQGSMSVFTMELARNALASQGVQAGDVILEIERDGQFFSGVAYAFLPGCSRESYEVTGSLSSDEQSIELKGRRPVRTADCVIRSYQDDTLALSRAITATTAPPPASVPSPSAGNSATGSQTPSFTCGGRLAPDEETICADPALASLDRRLDAAYRNLRAQLDPAQFVRLREEQRHWLGQRQKCTMDRNCLTTLFQSRIAQLENWR
jgi:uncharacterized protein